MIKKNKILWIWINLLLIIQFTSNTHKKKVNKIILIRDKLDVHTQVLIDLINPNTRRVISVKRYILQFDNNEMRGFPARTKAINNIINEQKSIKPNKKNSHQNHIIIIICW